MPFNFPCHSRTPGYTIVSCRLSLLDLVLEVLALDEVGNLIIVLALLALLHVLVALGELSEGGERVGAELVKDAGNELSELLVLAVAVDGEGVGGDGGVNYNRQFVSK